MQETFDISKNKLKLQLQGDWTNGEGVWPGTQSMCLSGQDSWFGLGHGHLRDSSTVSVWIQPAQDWQDTNLCILDTSGGSMLLLTASGSIRLQASPEVTTCATVWLALIVCCRILLSQLLLA